MNYNLKFKFLTTDHFWLILRTFIQVIGTFSFIKLGLAILGSNQYASVILFFSLINILRTLCVTFMEEVIPLELIKLTKNSQRRDVYYITNVVSFQILIFSLSFLPLLIVLHFLSGSAIEFSIFLVCSFFEILMPTLLFHARKDFMNIFLCALIIQICNILPLIIIFSIDENSLLMFAIVRLFCMILLPSLFFEMYRRVLKNIMNSIKKIKVRRIRKMYLRLQLVALTKMIITFSVEAPVWILGSVGQELALIAYDVIRKINEALKQIVRIFTSIDLVKSKNMSTYTIIRSRSFISAPLYAVAIGAYPILVDFYGVNELPSLIYLYIAFLPIILSGISGSLATLSLLKMNREREFFLSALIGGIFWMVIAFTTSESTLLKMIILVALYELIVFMVRFRYSLRVDRCAT